MKLDKLHVSAWPEAEPMTMRGSAPAHAKSGVPFAERPTGVFRSEHIVYPRVLGVLPKHQFLKQLQREKRRADRSKVPLSLVLFHLHGEKSAEDANARDLLRILSGSKRGTDILGYCGEETIAILLPDTDAQGAEGCAKKIASHAGKLRLSTDTVTYPDQIFDALEKEDQDLPDDSCPLFLDCSKDRHERGYTLKRSLDIIGAISGMVLFSPFMLITALAIAWTSPGPVIFKQIRIGKRGAPFTFYKFRSMYVNADDRIHREFVTKLINGDLDEINQGDKANPHYKLKSDPRVTRVGQFIRETCLDELPQLFNVLKGEMTLVGPRPPVPYEVVNYESWHLRRVLEIKPGITGLWQVAGHSTTTFDDMVRLDLQYANDCSLMLDLKILFSTVRKVLKGVGARL